METKQSPYQIFKEWLFGNKDEIDDYIFKMINPRIVLCMMMGYGGISIKLEELFNNFRLYKLNHMEFFLFMKYLINLKKLDKRYVTYFKIPKKDNKYKKIQSIYPFLKESDISLLISEVEDKETKEYVKLFKINFGLEDEKISKPKVVKNKKSKDVKKNENKIVSFSDLKKMFGVV